MVTTAENPINSQKKSKDRPVPQVSLLERQYAQLHSLEEQLAQKAVTPEEKEEVESKIAALLERIAATPGVAS